jgi:hypothetical protein
VTSSRPVSRASNSSGLRGKTNVDDGLQPTPVGGWVDIQSVAANDPRSLH